MGTRLYVEFNTPEDEASFFQTTVENVSNSREEYKRWESEDPGQLNPNWHNWYNSLSMLAREISDYDLFGLGKLQFDASGIVPRTKLYAGITHDKAQMYQLLLDHSATCLYCRDMTDRVILLFNSLKSVSWG